MIDIDEVLSLIADLGIIKMLYEPASSEYSEIEQTISDLGLIIQLATPTH